MTSSADSSEPLAITLDSARLLASSDSIRVALISKAGAKWHIWMEGNRKNAGFVLKTARGDVRLFTSIEAAARTVKAIGLSHALLRLDNWQEEQGEL